MKLTTDLAELFRNIPVFDLKAEDEGGVPYDIRTGPETTARTLWNVNPASARLTYWNVENGKVAYLYDAALPSREKTEFDAWRFLTERGVEAVPGGKAVAGSSPTVLATERGVYTEDSSLQWKGGLGEIWTGVGYDQRGYSNGWGCRSRLCYAEGALTLLGHSVRSITWERPCVNMESPFFDKGRWNVERALEKGMAEASLELPKDGPHRDGTEYFRRVVKSGTEFPLLSLRVETDRGWYFARPFYGVEWELDGVQFSYRAPHASGTVRSGQGTFDRSFDCKTALERLYSAMKKNTAEDAGKLLAKWRFVDAITL